MRNRLISLIRAGVVEHETNFENYVIPMTDYLADYLLKNGVIVPPCKVGATVYRVVKMYDGNRVVVEGEIIDVEVTNLINNTNEYKCYFSSKDDEIDDSRLYSTPLYFDDFGKTVFLTREEAEQALKGGAE